MGYGYGVVMRRACNRPPYEIATQKKVETLKKERGKARRNILRHSVVELFIRGKLQMAAGTTSSEKAAGVDGIPTEAIKGSKVKWKSRGSFTSGSEFRLTNLYSIF